MRAHLTLTLALLASACGPALYKEAEAPHPLATPGRITAPPIERLNESCKDQMGSVEACTSRARLTEISDSEVCAAVTLGENEEAERYVDKTQFTLRSSTGNVDKGHVRDQDDRPATIRGIVVEYRNMPGGDVQRFDRPHMYRWVFATREVCFKNAGVLTPETEWLEVRANTPGDLLSAAYRWRFAGGALKK